MEDKDKKEESRQFVLPLSELIDRLTINHIKLVKTNVENSGYIDEINKISSDMDKLIVSNNMSLNAKIIRMIIILSQINLHIWNNKDEMQLNLDNEKEYMKFLKLSHQLNGIRNKIRNILLDEEGISDIGHVRSNFETDGLDWDFKL